jgi:SdrD B-like domain
VFNDVNGDGRRGPNEATVSGAFITVVLPDGTRRTAVADRDGRYVFEAVPTGPIQILVLSNGITRTEGASVLDSTAQLDVPVGVNPLALAFTGDDVRWPTMLAVALLALGALLLAPAGRRQRRRP